MTFRFQTSWGIFWALLYCMYVPAYAQEPRTEPLTPTDTVALWNTCYGTAEMDRCADITTAGMRKHKPKSVWVYDTWKQLDRVEYRKETSEVIREEIDGEQAVVVTQSRIYALGGYVDQKELFRLTQIDGVWLIDDLLVGDEVLEEQLEQL